MSIVTKESNSELYNALFEDATIEDAKKVMQNMFNDITPEQFEELKKQALENVKKNNMSAKEIFEKLGYKKLPKKYNKNMILYESSYLESAGKIIIYFSLIDKRIQFSPYYRYSVKELEAINKQVEELGWLGSDDNE